MLLSARTTTSAPRNSKIARRHSQRCREMGMIKGEVRLAEPGTRHEPHVRPSRSATKEGSPHRAGGGTEPCRPLCLISGRSGRFEAASPPRPPLCHATHGAEIRSAFVLQVGQQRSRRASRRTAIGRLPLFLSACFFCVGERARSSLWEMKEVESREREAETMGSWFRKCASGSIPRKQSAAMKGE